MPRNQSNVETLSLVDHSVEGWMSPPQINALYELAKQSHDHIVEIGSHQGRSTICLALGLLDRPHLKATDRVWAVDPLEDLVVEPGSVRTPQPESIGQYRVDKFNKNIRNFHVEGVVNFIRKKSVEAFYDWIRPPEGETVGIRPFVGLLFIDGNHTKEACLEDLETWGLTVFQGWESPGAYIAVHDYRNQDYPGVAEAVDEFVSKHQDLQRDREVPWSSDPYSGSMIVYRKRRSTP